MSYTQIKFKVINFKNLNTKNLLAYYRAERSRAYLHRRYQEAGCETESYYKTVDWFTYLNNIKNELDKRPNIEK